MSFNKWDYRFLETAQFISNWSKDPSTKTGAVIVRPRNRIVGWGYNGFAHNMKDDPELYANREIKYSRVIHCEINALLNAAQSVDGCTLYTTGPCCDRCAVHMLHAGINRFVFFEPSPEQAVRWNVERTYSYFKEAGVEVVPVPL